MATVTEAKAMRALIQTSMARWESMDAAGHLLGRGLGRRELLGRVAREVDRSIREVQAALKSN